MASEILSKLLLEYDQKKRKAELDADKRKEELYTKIPRLQEIENELNNYAINTAKSILYGTSYGITELNAKIANLKSEKEKILKENNSKNVVLFLFDGLGYLIMNVQYVKILVIYKPEHLHLVYVLV